VAAISSEWWGGRGGAPSEVRGQSPWSGGHSPPEAEKKFYPNGKYVLKILLNGQSVGGHLPLRPPVKMLEGRVPPPPPPIIAAPAKRPAHDSIALQTQQDPNAGNSRATIECRSV